MPVQTGPAPRTHRDYEPYVDDEGFLDWRDPYEDTVVDRDMGELNARFGLG